MYKAMLIESFTWLFMEVETLMLYDCDIDITEKNILENLKDTFYTVFCYLADIGSYEGIYSNGDYDYYEILDILYGCSQQEKCILNDNVMKMYNENDILKLMEDAIKLIQFLSLKK